MKTAKENQIVCKCRKCNKPYSYNKFKRYAFGELCRECGERKGK